MLGRRPTENGDTLIEVLLSITIFSLVAVGVITIMNQGANASQRAVEITLVRQQLDSQAESLRAIHQAYFRKSPEAKPDSLWAKIAAQDDTDAPLDVNEVCKNESPDPNALSSKNVFALERGGNGIIDANDIKLITSADAPPYARVLDGALYSMWIEKDTLPSPGSVAGTTVPDAYDFRIRACWFGVGLSTPMQLQTVVRLYKHEGAS